MKKTQNQVQEIGIKKRIVSEMKVHSNDLRL